MIGQYRFFPAQTGRLGVSIEFGVKMRWNPFGILRLVMTDSHRFVACALGSCDSGFSNANYP
jgi:hypothetical protein